MILGGNQCDLTGQVVVELYERRCALVNGYSSKIVQMRDGGLQELCHYCMLKVYK